MEQGRTGDWIQERKADRQADLDRRQRFGILGGEVLDRSDQGVPERWVCGKENGNLVDPPEIDDSQVIIHFIATLEQAKVKGSQMPEWQGALAHHPAVSDRPDWIMPPPIDYAEIAKIEAEINRQFGN